MRIRAVRNGIKTRIEGERMRERKKMKVKGKRMRENKIEKQRKLEREKERSVHNTNDTFFYLAYEKKKLFQLKVSKARHSESPKLTL